VIEWISNDKKRSKIMVEKVGDRIRARWQELGLSVDEVATKLNINRATIYRYESNEIEKFSITVLEPLAEVLKTTPAYLIGWDNPNIDDVIERSPYGEIPDELKNLDLSKRDVKMIQTYLRAKKSDKSIVQGLVQTIDKLLGIDESGDDK
jgi:transcriptional regulator with XRE-family HTH domain